MHFIRKIYKKLILKNKNIFVILVVNMKNSLIDSLRAYNAYLFAHQKRIKRLSGVEICALEVMPICLGHLSRRLLIARCQFATMLVQKLLCAPGINHLHFQKFIFRRLHLLEHSNSTCLATLTEEYVLCGDFHPFKPLVLTGSNQKIKVWCLSLNRLVLICDKPEGCHTHDVYSVKWDKNNPTRILTAGTNTAKVWEFSPDDKSTLKLTDNLSWESSESIRDVLLDHPLGDFPIALCGFDNRVKIFKFSPRNPSDKHLSDTELFNLRLRGHTSRVRTAAMHLTSPIIATGSYDKTVRLWEISSDLSSSVCFATLKHDDFVWRVEFHQQLPLLVTFSDDNKVNFWRHSCNSSPPTCVGTLPEHTSNMSSAALHPKLPFLATGYENGDAKMWYISSNNLSPTCVGILAGHDSHVSSIVFHQTLPLLMIVYGDRTLKVFS
jgi:WD40 repeat protein